MREEILKAGRARPHRVGVKGYVSQPVKGAEDVNAVLAILRANYGRAKAAAEREPDAEGGSDA